ncbi:MAG TPA: hypothetical protein VN698_06975, partial [Bacteroidia bacterium]|nr:hypothetical protein [Bacteroidia bacterium]
MSTEEQNFDDLLKSKLNESEFAFNEANWDKAEQLIIRAEEKRKRRRIGFIFFFGMLLGICIMIPFIGDKSSIDKNLRSEKEALAYTNKIETKPKIESSKKVTEADVKPMNKNGGSNSISKSEVDKNSIKEVRKEDGEKTNLIEPGRTKKQKNSLANEVLTQVKEPNTNRKAPQSVRGEDYKSESNMPIIKEKEIIGSNESIKNKKEGIIEKANEIVSINQEKTESQAISVQTSDSANIPVLINSSLKKDTVITIKDSIIKTKIDSSKAIALDTTKAFKKSTIFSIDAGVNYTFGWTNNSTKEAAGVNAIFGISTTHQFSKKWGALLGIQYTSLAHLNYSNFTSNNLQYDFG